MDLRDKKIIVTGGANGIGFSLARKLAAEPCKVCVIDRDANGAGKLKQLGPNLSFHHADVSDYEQVDRAIQSFIGEHGNIDIVVNNAGILVDFPLISFDRESRRNNLRKWDEVIGTNLTSVYYVTSIAAENMVRNRVKGVIVNISSISSSGNMGQTAYAASKSGVNAMTITWAKELAPFGIRVAGIAPGFINTSMFLDSMNEGIRDKLLKKVLLKRAGEPENIADTVLFIIKNDYITCQVFTIDGGSEL